MASGDDGAKPTGDPNAEIKRLVDTAEPIGADALQDATAQDAKAKAVAGVKGKAPKGSAAPGGASKAKSEDKPAKKRRTPQRDSLMALTEDCDLWHDEDGEAYATFAVGNHRESWGVRSQKFKRWLAYRAFETTGLVPGAQAVEDTLRVLEAKATQGGRQQEPWSRVGTQNGFLYLDLVTADWSVVQIGPNSWDVIKGHGLPFVRSSGMRALCMPEGGSEIGELRRFINVATDEDFQLVVAWLVAALRATGPYPVLVVNGEQGSGKSTFSKLIRTLVDPNAAPIRGVPKDPRDLFIAASNGHMLVMDNLSRVEPWLSDALCSIATGGGYATRQLQSDRGEALFMVARPIVLNGIPALTERADLAQRSVTIQLRTIEEDERRAEDEFWADWEVTAPRVLGALLDGLSSAVRRIDSVRLDRFPRLADFTKWMTAAEPGLGWEAGTFDAAYRDNQEETNQTAFESDPVAMQICRLVAPFEHGWEGTAVDLLAALNEIAPESVLRLKSWPVTSQGLGNRLVRCAPLVRAKGFNIEKRHSGIRTIRISPIEKRGA